MKNILYTIALLSFALLGQLTAQNWMPAPGEMPDKPVYIMGGTVHVGNGEVIENATLSFSDGKISLVAADTPIRMKEDQAIQIDATGKHIYPGLISPMTLTGLVEVEALRQTRDYREVGGIKPHVRSIIAYNTDSWVTPTIRSNGVLISQIVPRGGRVPGTSSVVQLDAWNWEDALVAEDNVLHLNWPSSITRGGWWAEPGNIKPNKNYDKQVDELKAFFAEAKAYVNGSPKETNLKFEAMRDVFSKKRKVFIAANHAKDISSAVLFAKEMDIEMVLVNGRDAWLLTDLLKENDIPVVLRRTHSLPFRDEDDIDLAYKMPALMEDAGILWCMTAQTGSGEQRNLPFTAGKSVAYGISKEQALASVTLNAAKILGIDDTYGSLEEGKSATLVISDGDILDGIGNQITHAFVDGRLVNLENKQKHLYRKFMKKYKLEPKRH